MTAGGRAVAYNPAMAMLLLASRSPRRARLLREAGYRFEQVVPPFDDTAAAAVSGSPEAAAMDLARRKAMSLADGRPADTVVLCADTVCVHPDGQTVGKPGGRDEAEAMIRAFVNTDHEVVTAVVMIDVHGEMVSLADTARVGFGPLADHRLPAYLDTGQWRDKAGGYNLFDRQADGWPITVTGDPATVVGLPMRRLGAVLADLGVTADVAGGVG